MFTIVISGIVKTKGSVFPILQINVSVVQTNEKEFGSQKITEWTIKQYGLRQMLLRPAVFLIRLSF